MILPRIGDNNCDDHPFAAWITCGVLTGPFDVTTVYSGLDVEGPAIEVQDVLVHRRKLRRVVIKPLRSKI